MSSHQKKLKDIKKVKENDKEIHPELYDEKGNISKKGLAKMSFLNLHNAGKITKGGLVKGNVPHHKKNYHRYGK